MTNFTGGTGNDTFDGGAGNDSASGNDGFDTLNGGGGADTLDGGADNDVLYSDVATGYYNRPYYNNPYTAPALDHGTQVDTLIGGGGYDVLSAGYGDNVDGGDYSNLLLISFQGASSGIIFDMNLTSQVIGGGTIQNVSSLGWTEGSEYNDTITGGGGSDGNFDPIFGMGGNDSLVSGYYTGNLYGGQGNDTLDGRGSGYGFILSGGAGDDIYLGGQIMEDAGEGMDTVISQYTSSLGANVENLTLTGFYAADATGNELNNVLIGNDGDNHIYGGAGNDTITGGADNGDGETTGDTAIYSGNRADYLVSEDAGTHLVTIVDLRGGSPDGTDTLDHTLELVQFADSTMTLADVISGVVPVPNDFVGDGSDDSYGGNERNNTAVGNDGDDTLGGKAGNDTLEGDAGSDSLDGGAGSDVLYSDEATGYYNRPYYSYSYTPPALDQGTAVDTLIGGDGGDLISAGFGDNVDGGDGDDLLLISFQGASTGVVFDINLSSQVIGGGTIENVENIVWIEGSEYNDTITDGGGSGGNFDPLFGMGGNDSLVSGYYTGNLYGGDGDDTLDARWAAYGFPIFGEAGNDTLYSGGGAADGGDGDDLLYGYGQVNGGAGNDTLAMGYGGTAHGDGGDDDITAGDSGQTLYGDAGNDILRGGAGNDLLNGGSGNDTITGGDNADPFGDVAVYSGALADYQVTEDADTHLVTIVDLRGDSPDGTDTIDHTIEALTFSDGTVGLDDLLSPAGPVPNDFVGGEGDDTYAGNLVNNTAQGNGGNDQLGGKGGNDTLDGGAGSDTLDGGAGSDVLYSDVATGYYNRPYYNNPYTAPALDHGTEVDTLIGGSGYDVLSAGYGDNVDGGDYGNLLLISFQGASSGIIFDMNLTSQVIGGGTIQNISNLGWTEGSEYNDTITGGGGSDGNFDPIFGMGGNDSLVSGYYTGNLYGGEGNDTLDARGTPYSFLVYGGAGDDVYLGGGQIIEAVGEGTDTVISQYDFTLGENLENLTFSGDWAVNATGNQLDNVLTGNALGNYLTGLDGNDRLIGGAGNDTMTGGAGNDTFIVDDLGDQVVEQAAQGVDMVSASFSYSLGNNVENLTLSGAAAIDGMGNGLANVITGNGAANHLTGLGGNDWLDGAAGADTMTGGVGADTYIVDEIGDVVIELAGHGTDTVKSSVRYTLGDNVERLTLTGTLNIAGTGNALDNILIGNEGNNRLDGGAGADTMAGGLGNDFYTIDNAGDVIREAVGQGIDGVIVGFSYALGGQYVENITLTGTTDINATGNALANTLIGNSGNNVLNGLSGIDKMFGGAGNDTYYIDNAGDRTYEVAHDLTDSGGHDVVYAGVQTTLEKFVEDLVITGTFNLGGTGNALDNHITGNSGNNVLTGRDGNDVLDGAGGADRLVGGLGDDSYYVDNVGDRVIENIGQGNDTVYSSTSFYLGHQYVETLALTGTADINAAGNDNANTLIGNDGNNVMNGGRGDDILTGGTGADTFFFNFQSGIDTITDFNSAEGDIIELHRMPADVIITMDGADILLDFSGGNTLRLVAPVNWDSHSILLT